MEVSPVDAVPQDLFKMDESKYSDPMPWIGLYVTAASIACSIAMVGDLLNGFCRRQLWIPCRLFSINATSLALLAIATKLPVDLSTPMRGAQDQLTKLSGTVVICVVMANFLPSLGAMQDSRVMLNVIPMGILVITVCINICIQIGTRVICSFKLAHILILCTMLIMLLLMGSSALTVLTTKQFLGQQYELKHQQASSHGLEDQAGKSMVLKLKNDVRRHWMMAQSCNPQYVICRSAIGTASGVFCLLGTLVFLFAFLSTPVTGGPGLPGCSSVLLDSPSYHRVGSISSDYKWSTTFILFSQVFLVVIGTVAPTCRWFHVVNSRSLQMKTWKEIKDEFKVETYWTSRLVEWKDSPLPYEIRNRSCRKFANGLKNLVLDVFIYMQILLILFCKTVRSISILVFYMLRVLRFCICCIPARWLFKSLGSSNDVTETEIRDFVLHLEGEANLVQLIMKLGLVDTEKWVHKGRKNQLTHLKDLLKKSTVSEGFKGVAEFDSNQVPSVALEEPPNCWALPLVTLSSIAIAISCTNGACIKQLLHGVNEGLKYVRLVERKLDMKGLASIREAADLVWLRVDLHHQWFDVDLAALTHEEKDPKKVIERLAEIGKKYALEGEANGYGNKGTAMKWSPKAVAGNSMYRICQTTLEDYGNNFSTVDELLEWLCVLISDILGACLTNLPRVVSMECCNSAIEAKEESVRQAAYLLGEIENILEALGIEVAPFLGVDQNACIDNWRLSKLKKSPSRAASTVSNGSMSNGELQISIQ